MKSVFAGPIAIQFCPDNPKNLRGINKDLNFLKNSEDTTRLDNSCVEIKTVPLREKLYTRYIQQKYPRVKVFTPHSFVKKDLCHIELTRVDIENRGETKIGNNLNQVSIGEIDQAGKSNFVGKYSVLSGNTSQIQFDDLQFNLTCIKTGAGFNISLKSISKSIGVTAQAFVKPNQTQELASFTQNSNKDKTRVGITDNKYEQRETKRRSRIMVKAN